MVPIRKSNDLYTTSLSVFALMLLLAACSDASEAETKAPAATSAVQTAVASPSASLSPPPAQPAATAGAVSSPSPTPAPSAAPSAPLPDRAQFLAIIRQLERTNLEIMAVAEKKALKEPAPTFAELKGELLNYNSEQAIKHWETMYEQSPGWILEPQGLVFAGEHSMLASSFTVEPQSDGKVMLQFKTFGNISYTRAHQVNYTVARNGNGDWIIDSLQVSPVMNGFNRGEALEAAKLEFGNVTLSKEDETYYYFKDNQVGSETYVFHKKEGYIDFVPSS